MLTCKRVIIGPYPTPYTKINSKWNKDLNIGSKTVKLLKENLSGKLCDIGLDTDLTPKTQAAKTK